MTQSNPAQNELQRAKIGHHTLNRKAARTILACLQRHEEVRVCAGFNGECVTRLHERLIATAHHRQSNDTSLPKVRADRTTLDSMTQQRQNRGRSRPRLHRITEYQRSPSGPARKWPRASLNLSIGPLQPEEHSSAFGLEAATRDYRRDCPRYVDKWR